jgi:hypothetical protein
MHLTIEGKNQRLLNWAAYPQFQIHILRNRFDDVLFLQGNTVLNYAETLSGIGVAL